MTRNSTSPLATLQKINIFFIVLFITVLYIFTQAHQTEFSKFFNSLQMRRGEVPECVKHFDEHPHRHPEGEKRWFDEFVDDKKCQLLAVAVPTYQLSCDLGLVPKKYDHCWEFENVTKRLSLKNLIRFQEWGESASALWNEYSIPDVAKESVQKVNNEVKKYAGRVASWVSRLRK